jgi:hypothetical protein
VRTYSFLSQIVEFATEDLARDYLYGKALLAFIRDTSRGGGVDLGTEVELTHLRTEKTFEGSVALDPETGEIQTVFSGSGKQHEADKSPLSHIIDTLNERFGVKLTDADRSGTTAGLREASLGRILGFDTYVSNNLPGTTPQAVAFHKSALVYASTIAETEGMRAENKFADRIRGLHVYGGKVTRPTAIQVFTAA